MEVRRYRWIVRCVAMGIVLTTAAWAETLPRLPEDFSFPLGEGSPGQVVFAHPSHIDEKQPNCTACHPGLFKILAKGLSAEGLRVTHSEMEQGRQCSACHNDQTAFGLDNCMTCHRETSE